MPEITVTTTTTFDPEKFYDLSDFRFASVYLAKPMMKMPGDSATPSKTVGIAITTWISPDDPSLGSEPHLVTWQQLGDAIAHLASGTHTDYDGRERQPRDYHVAAAAGILRDVDEADWDAATEDLILQQAVFGKVLYG